LQVTSAKELNHASPLHCTTQRKKKHVCLRHLDFLSTFHPAIAGKFPPKKLSVIIQLAQIL
jgi:hypothetical protein